MHDEGEPIVVESEKTMDNPDVSTGLTKTEISEEHLLLMGSFSPSQSEDFDRFLLWRKISQQAALIGRSWSEDSM